MEDETFEVEQADGSKMLFITHYFDEFNAVTFPADDANPDYQRYLLELSQAKK
jgi:hypothetical protein